MTTLAPLVATTVTEAARQIIQNLKPGTEFTIGQVAETIQRDTDLKRNRQRLLVHTQVTRMLASGEIKHIGRSGHSHLYQRVEKPQGA